MGENIELSDEIINNIERIRSDNTHGSTFLTKKAIQLIGYYVQVPNQHLPPSLHS